MNKSYREGIDLEVAFASEMKRAHAAAPPSLEPLPVVPDPMPNRAQAISVPTGPLAPSVRAPLTAVYRWIKPALRPFASRIRRYLSAPLLRDVHHAQTLLEDVRRTQAVALQDLRRLHAALLQEARHVGDQLEGDLQATKAATLEEIRASRDAAARDLASFRGGLDRDLALVQRATVDAIRTAAGEMQSGLARTESAAAALHEAVNAVGASNLDGVRDVRDALLREWSQRQAAATREASEAESRLASRLDRIERYAMTSARRVAINCGDGILVRTEVGYVLCPPADHAILARLVETGEIERGTRALIARLLEPGQLFVDVGANLGLHTLAGCRAVGESGQVIAFEPFAPTVELLRKSIWINGFADIVDIRQAAASNHDGRRRLYLGATTGHHSLFPLREPSAGTGPASVDVPIVRLDDAVGVGRPVSLIKIDVEGAELEVLSGAHALIEQNPDVAIIAEFGPTHLARIGVSIADWFAAFERLGLVQRRIDDDSGALTSDSAETIGQLRSVNLLFSRPGSRAWVLAEATR